MTNNRKNYRIYLNETPIGISIYAYAFEADLEREVLWFSDANQDTVCCIGLERVERVVCDNMTIWQASVVA